MKSAINIKNLNKSCFFDHDNRHDIKNYYVLKNKIERLIDKGHLQCFVKKEMQYKLKKKEIDITQDVFSR
jgi:hypothetical protein